FGIVVVATGIDWPKLFDGFFTFQIPEVEGITTVILGAIGASVGINMTFLYPYSLLAKGWGKSHKVLARWDLAMSMFLPFVLVTSLVIIAMANTVHLQVKKEHEQQVAAYEAQVKAGTAEAGNPPKIEIDRKMKPVRAAKALTGVMGENLGRIIFDLGFIAMTCGAISVHMVVCGFTACEMFGLQYSTWRYRLFTLIPVIGILGVVAETPFWLPVAASAICLTMLPIAYIAFFLMNNKRSYLGDAVGHGWKRFVFNLILLVAIAMCTIGAAIKLKGGVYDKLFGAAPAPAASTTSDPADK
ncbi:MAG: divalent metal cation transporter, partial [Candidatus Nealsonbacteria bacterium]|nr:divalent metal cation transporter [Candidatus Nealsonbacteria bacterium]